ncbi:MAG: Gfo/Idh/MocA family oxidoreductase [Nocardioides sp.]|uniref:Gfo/Idh/MocA family protein n=1 Tax=Nocardioides sp. TaxID=35761 RepID=UPI0039E22A53
MASTRILNAAVIGTGFIGMVHARAVRAAGHRVAAIVGIDEDSARQVAADVSADLVLDSVAEMLRLDEIDVVHVCTPNALHAEQARLALEHGKHVICEKPLATSVDDARGLCTLARQLGLVTAVPFAYRFYPTVREARARVMSGEAGRVRLLHGSYLQDWLADAGDTNWRVDSAVGGASRAFADIGVHWCDLIEFTTGHRLTRVAAHLYTVPERRTMGNGSTGHTEDVATVMFETDQGAVGSVIVSQVSLGRKNRLWFSIDGTDAALSFNQEVPDTLWIGGLDANQEVFRGSAATSAAAHRYDVLPAGHPQGFQNSFEALVGDAYATVLGEHRDGLPTFEDGLRATVITQAVLHSARTESWVKVPPSTELG